MAETHPLVAAFDEKRRTAKIPLARVCKLAAVNYTTPWRWVTQGAVPELPTLDRMNAALDQLISEKVKAASSVAPPKRAGGSRA